MLRVRNLYYILVSWDARRKLHLGSERNYIGQQMISGHQKEVTEYFSILSNGRSRREGSNWRT